MTTQSLEKYLHDHIPLTIALGVRVLEANQEQVVIGAPLAPNINHTETVFGGSASAVAILAAWSLLHLRLRELGIASTIVIQRNTMEYAKPVSGDFVARAFLTEPDLWPRFLHTLARKGRARVSVSANLEFEGQVAGNLEGDFVAIVKPPAQSVA